MPTQASYETKFLLRLSQRAFSVWLVGVKFYPKSKSAYFLSFECFAGSETCFFSFLFWSFSLCSFLCCSKPAAFFSLLDKNSSTLEGNRSIMHSKTLSFCPQLESVYSIPNIPIYVPIMVLIYAIPLFHYCNQQTMS